MMTERLHLGRKHELVQSVLVKHAPEVTEVLVKSTPRVKAIRTAILEVCFGRANAS